jgi:hypothetical protein
MDARLLPLPDVPLGPARTWDMKCEGNAYQQAVGAAWEDLTRLYTRFTAPGTPQYDMGGTRSVFDGGEAVYKIGDLECQLTELAAFEYPESYDYLPVAPCRIVWHSAGAPILVMQTVLPAVPGDELPEWASRVDSAQVGWTAGGQCVIFDAGFDLAPEHTAKSLGWMDHPLPALFDAG